MGLGVIAQQMSLRKNAADEMGMAGGFLTDDKESGASPVRPKKVQHSFGFSWLRPVINRQPDKTLAVRDAKGGHDPPQPLAGRHQPRPEQSGVGGKKCKKSPPKVAPPPEYGKTQCPQNQSSH